MDDNSLKLKKEGMNAIIADLSTPMAVEEIEKMIVSYVESVYHTPVEITPEQRKKMEEVLKNREI